MRTLLLYFVMMTIGNIGMLGVQDAIAKQSMADRRAQRHATEIIYQSCLSTCFEGCRK